MQNNNVGTTKKPDKKTNTTKGTTTKTDKKVGTTKKDETKTGTTKKVVEQPVNTTSTEKNDKTAKTVKVTSDKNATQGSANKTVTKNQKKTGGVGAGSLLSKAGAVFISTTTDNQSTLNKFFKNGFNNLVSGISKVFDGDDDKKTVAQDREKRKGRDFNQNLRIAFRYTAAISTTGILGLPPKFTSLADIRLFNYKSIDKEGRTSILHSDLEEYINSDRYDAYFFSEPYQGQKWIEVYLKYASLVFFEIGRPIFFNGISSEVKEAILSQQISQNDNIKLAATEVAGDTASAATLITFAPAGVEYAFGVKLLTDAIAQFMDIDGESVNEFLNAHNFNAAGRGSLWRHDLQTGVGSITQYRDYFGLPKSYDNAVRVDKDGKRTTDHIEVKDLATEKKHNAVKGLMNSNGNSFPVGGHGRYDVNDYTNDIYAEIKGSTICVYSDGGIEAPLNISHETGPSTILAPLVNNAVIDSMAEISFFAKDFDPQTTTASEGVYDEQNKFMSFLKKIMHISSVGAKLVAPEVWKGSGMERSFEVKMVLQATSPTKVCIFREIMVPYMHILEMVSPRNITHVSNAMANRLGALAPPYVLRMYCRGAATVNLGLPTSITVNKNPKDLTIDGLPTRLEITMTIKDLYGIFGVPIYKDTNTRLAIVQCMGLTEYLSALTGVVMSQEKIRDMYLISLKDTSMKSYSFNVVKKFAARIQTSLFQGYNERVSGAIGSIVGKINKIF